VDGVQINQYDMGGKKQGYWEKYDEDNIEKGNYVDGKEEGIWEYFYPNGQLSMKGSYKNGEYNGKWVFFHEDGSLDQKGSFKNGERYGEWSWYENNLLHSKCSFKNGKANGIWEFYNEDGSLRSKSLYDNGYLVKELPLNESIKASEAHTEIGSFRTLEDGKRNIAWIQINTIPYKLQKYIIDSSEKNNFGAIRVLENPKKPVIIYRQGYKEQAEELYNIAKKYNGYLAWNASYEDSKRIGELLEYTPKDIEKYLNKNYTDKKLNEGQVYNYKLDKSHADPTQRRIIYNFTNKNGYDFEVIFYNLGDNNWEREYSTNQGLAVLNANDAYNILETITNITLDFIERYEPNNITIFHIKKNKEESGDPRKPSKRALINKKYLEPAINKLDDYYYKLLGSTSYISKI
jgi:hypothetical protein